MNRLFIYGDSFSDYYMPSLVDKFWFEILAENLNLELVHRAKSGFGWQRINSIVIQDSCKWTHKDIIFICPSFFTRLDIVDFNIDEPLETIEYPCVEFLDELDKRELYNMKNWYYTVKFFKKNKYKVYTWALDPVIEQYRTISIPPPRQYNSWYEWVLSNKEHWVIPYPHNGGDGGTLIEKDTHLSTEASKFLADYFLNYIRNGKTQSSYLL